MKNKYLILIAFFLIVLTMKTKAQSAVYFCSQTNQWGYSFGGGNIRNSEADAFKRCQNSGGRNPQKIISTNGKGYGAIVTGNAGNGGPKFGTSAGARTQEDATMAAVRSCMQQGAMKNIEIKATWFDK